MRLQWLNLRRQRLNFDQRLLNLGRAQLNLDVSAVIWVGGGLIQSLTARAKFGSEAACLGMYELNVGRLLINLL